MIVRLKQINPLAKLPTRAKPGDSGWDVYCLKDTLILPEDGVVCIKTGLQVAFITPGFEIQCRAKSGRTWKKHYIVANAPGTIDNKYRGEIGVLIKAFRDLDLKAGETFAQLVPAAVPEATFEWSDVVDETERGAGGFGSTGE